MVRPRRVVLGALVVTDTHLKRRELPGLEAQSPELIDRTTTGAEGFAVAPRLFGALASVLADDTWAWLEDDDTERAWRAVDMLVVRAACLERASMRAIMHSVAATVVAFAFLLMLPSACSPGNAAIGDGGAYGDAGADGTPEPTGDAGPGTDSQSVCPPLSPPVTSKAVALKFDRLRTGGVSNEWMGIGFDQDGLCTTRQSTNVCKRNAGATASMQEDGDDGIDNSVGSHQLLVLPGMDVAGYLTIDATGTGSLALLDRGARIDLPLLRTKITMNGTEAVLAAIIPLEPLLAVIDPYVGQLSSQLCSGTALEDMHTRFRGAADMLQDGTQSPSVSCDAISIGAILTGVAPGTAPAFHPVDPCPR